MKVIPAVNEENFSAVLEKIRILEGKCDWIQIDVSDGIFTPKKLWNNPQDLKNLDFSSNIEIHLMIEDPISVLKDWLEIFAVKRLVFHCESRGNLNFLIDQCRKNGKEAGLALKPETSVEKVIPYLNGISQVLFLAVDPGWSGQTFNPAVLEKIKYLKNFYPEAIVEVDGGINLETAKILKDKGADILNSASYLFNSPDILKAISDLEKI